MTIQFTFIIALSAFVVGYLLGTITMALVTAGRHHDDEEGRPR